MAIDTLVPTVNGVEYTHADIIVNFGGVPLIGVISIEYGDTQAITANYSTGNKPTSYGMGQVEFTGSLTLTFSAMQVLQATAPGGYIQNYPAFDLGVNYLPDSGILVRDVLRKCRFTGRNLSSETGNSEIPVTLELFVSDIGYQRA